MEHSLSGCTSGTSRATGDLVLKAREALRNCEDLSENMKASFEEKPDSYIEMMLDKVSEGLDAFKLFLDPEHIEKAQTLFEIFQNFI